MATIQNQAIIQKLVDELELYPALDKVPTELAEKILPVFQVNTQEIITKDPEANVVASATTGGGTGANTIYSVPATGKFFLTNVFLQGAGGGAGTNDDVTITPKDQVAVEIIDMYRPVGQIVLNLKNPIELEPSSLIVLNNNSTANVNAGIVGYTE